MLAAAFFLLPKHTVSAQPTQTGYVTKDIPEGFSLLVMPLQPHDPRVVILFDGPPDGTEVVVYDGNGWITNRFENLAWTYPDMRLQMGRGMIFNSPTAWSHTWVGEVWAGDLGNMIPAGESLTGGLIPQKGRLGADLEFPAIEGIEIQTINAESGEFESAAIVESGIWTPSEPVVSVGEAFRVRSPETFVWRRTFVPADHPGFGDFIVNDPVGGSFEPGASIQLSVETDDGPYEFQWQRNGIDIPDATNAVLSISALGESTAGDYLVRVFNQATVDTSAIATVSILANEAFLTIAWDAGENRPVLNAGIPEGQSADYEVSTDLISWIPLEDVVVIGDGSIADSAAGAYSMRFYRLRMN